jgi:hypothetical protein
MKRPPAAGAGDNPGSHRDFWRANPTLAAWSLSQSPPKPSPRTGRRRREPRGRPSPRRQGRLSSPLPHGVVEQARGAAFGPPFLRRIILIQPTRCKSFGPALNGVVGQSTATKACRSPCGVRPVLSGLGRGRLSGRPFCCAAFSSMRYHPGNASRRLPGPV